ncbi:MAG: sigma-70 family RNA polymerase sigma factor [Deltaproteobacteria bacterium]|nr:sigma-70 family RNA polymerase sigma factor [Deltaproteobacteria bacterium]
MVEQYQNQVFNLLFRMAGTREEAEDLTQEVFVTVFKSIDQFRGDSKFSTWLYRIAVNHCKNRIKYLARRHDRDTSELDEAAEKMSVAQGGIPITSSAFERPDTALEGRERDGLVMEAIASLDEEHRVVVVLRDIEELSYEEIAQITGLPEGTVKSRIHRARLQLKEKLAGYMQGKR